MKHAVKKLFAALALTSAAASAHAVTYTYVGSWYVGDGPLWTTNPAVYNAQEVAALLFGGVASDYAISTISDDVNDINFMAFVDGWSDNQFLFTPVSQSFSLDLGNPGYNDPMGAQSAYSAYVLDHSCEYRYSDLSLSCAAGAPGLNYAFRINDVPEPASIALLGLAAAGLAASRRRK